MTEPSRAVFLSYASQDAEAARRICDALRAAGIEVWFDQSELRGGDAWDRQIRKQIHDCALFVPVISANTQARLEGYFRLEWRLAVERTHLMADAKPFLLPVGGELAVCPDPPQSCSLAHDHGGGTVRMMRELLLLAIHLLVTCAKLLRPGGARAVAAESLLLKHQLLISNRSRQRAPNLTSVDRLVLGLTTLLMSPGRIPKLGALLKPASLLKFHKALVDRKYRLLFSSSSHRRKPGPKGPSAALIAAILEIKRRNPRFGCVRIAQQISHAFGVQIDKDVVRRVLARYHRPGAGTEGPSWLSFIGHAKDSLWSIDLFRCESILLRSHWVMLVMDVFTRRIVGFGVESGGIDGVSVSRMFNRARTGQRLPRHASTDHDPLFRFHRWLANLRVLEIEEIKSVSYTPVSHPFVERLIGTIRREYLDRAFFWNAVDLVRKLSEFRDYYNAHRVHRSLDGTTPAQRAGATRAAHATLDQYTWRQHCRGLFQTPIAA